MNKMQPWLRWVVIFAAAAALAFAYFSPRRPEAVATPDDSPPPRIEAGSPSPEPSASPTVLAIYVCGAVKKTGVYRLPIGSRVIDAVSLAGGLTGDADTEAINLAEPLVDGMKVDVGKKGAAPNYSAESAGSGAPRHHHGSGRAGAHKLQPGQTLDINTAGESDLVQLPGVGPSLARRIVEYRQANVPFATIDDLQNVSGIGPSKFAKMEPFVRL